MSPTTALATLLSLLLSRLPIPAAPIAPSAEPGRGVARQDGPQSAELRPAESRPAESRSAEVTLQPGGTEVTAAEYWARRAALAAGLGDGLVFLEGGTSDENRRFVQDNNFWYLTGIPTAGAALLLVVADGRIASERLFLPARSRFQGWSTPPLAPGEEVERRFLFASTAASARVAADLAEALPAAKTLFTTLESRGRGRGPAESRPGAASGAPLESRPGPRAGQRPASTVLAEAVAQQDGVALKPVQSALAEIRVVKSAAEQVLMRRTIEITCAAMIEGFAALRPGAFEYEIEAAVEAGFRRRGALGLAFPTIIGSGPNSCILHYNDNVRRMGEDEVVVMDIGAKYGFYCADVTRTVPTSGRFTPRQREIYGIVLAAQKAALAVIRPKVPFRNVHKAAADVIQAAGYLPFFNHGTSHHLGLDVHDPGGRRGGTLEAGMVITVEPGIYLPKEGIGFRIEDDVLVTEEGSELLSRFVPREIDELEALIARLREGPPPLDGRRFMPAEEHRR